jgi:hypothetical protein
MTLYVLDTDHLSLNLRGGMITSLPLSLITDSSSKRGMENLEVQAHKNEYRQITPLKVA